MDKCPSLHTPQNSEICTTQYLREPQPFLPPAVPRLITPAFLLSLSHSPPLLCVFWDHFLNKLYPNPCLRFSLVRAVTQYKPAFILVFKLVFHILKDPGKNRQNIICACFWHEIVQPWMNFLFHLFSLILIPVCCLSASRCILSLCGDRELNHMCMERHLRAAMPAFPPKHRLPRAVEKAEEDGLW